MRMYKVMKNVDIINVLDRFKYEKSMPEYNFLILKGKLIF